jgi:mono/diheme cytochrome c family protein
VHDAALRANVRTRILTPALAAVTLLGLASAAFGATTATRPKGNVVNGRALFRKHCGTCHRLAAAKTHGTVGPNLNLERVSYADGIWVMNGGLSTMPGFKGTLEPAQIRDVAAFLAKATGA